MWNWVRGEGDREAGERVPRLYCTAWPGSLEPPVGAKMRFAVVVAAEAAAEAVVAAECSILGACEWVRGGGVGLGRWWREETMDERDESMRGLQ